MSTEVVASSVQREYLRISQKEIKAKISSCLWQWSWLSGAFFCDRLLGYGPLMFAWYWHDIAWYRIIVMAYSLYFPPTSVACLPRCPLLMMILNLWHPDSCFPMVKESWWRYVRCVYGRYFVTFCAASSIWYTLFCVPVWLTVKHDLVFRSTAWTHTLLRRESAHASMTATL